MIQALDAGAYRDIYRNHIERDFHRDERRPLSLIRRLHARGMYTLLAMRDDDTGALQAYAGLLHAPDVESVLLDYFAVEPPLRGTGIGSRFLDGLRGHIAGSGAIVECESPALARDEAERVTRERRIAFYLRNGAEETGKNWTFFGVGYDLLWLPGRKHHAEVDVRRDVAALYGKGVPSAVGRLFRRVMGAGRSRG